MRAFFVSVIFYLPDLAHVIFKIYLRNRIE